MVFVAGRVGRVEKRTINSKNGETSVLNISIAENVRDAREESGKRTNWYHTAIFGKYADTMAKYVEKGTLIQASGDLRIREYSTKDGGSGVSVEIDNPALSLLGGGKKDDAQGGQAASPANTADDSFINVPDGMDTEIPFN